MNDQERKDAAAKLVQAVKNNTNGAYDKWTNLDTSDDNKRAAYVKDVLNLAQAPTKEDLDEMHRHATTSLGDQVEDMRNARPDAHTVGFLCLSSND